MTNKLILLLITRLALLIGFAILGFVFLLKDVGFGFVLSIIAVVVCAWFIVKTFTSTMNKVGFMFNSIENDDFTFRFIADANSNKNVRYINDALNRIKDLVSAARVDARNQERYYELILDKISVGVVVCNEQGVVFNVNDACLKNIGIPYFTHLRQLEASHLGVYKALSEIKDGQTLSVKYYDEASLVTLSLSCSFVESYNQVAKVVTVTNIAQEIDNNEMESWQRLSRVLTHEIMNSLAPITSLSETLLEVDDNQVQKKGLVVINDTAKRLTAFVENYRKLTKVPMPTLCLVDMKELVYRSVTLFDFPVEVRINTSAFVIEVDKSLISQVVVNLIKNAIEAPQTKRVWISIWRNDIGEFVLDVCNDGDLITDDMRENIFIPFFTTKEQGSGIGLSLCRQIVRMHKGKLNLITKPHTVFRIQI